MCTGAHPFIPAERTARVVLHWDTPGGKALNVLYFQKATDWSSADLSTLLDELSTTWDANFSSFQSNAVDCNRMVLTDMSAEGSFEVDAPPTDDLTGESGSPIMPGNVTVATKFTTGLAGRSHRGRTFFVGLVEEVCVGDELAPGRADAMTAAWNALNLAVQSSSLAATLVVVSFCADGVWRTNAEVTVVTEVFTDNVLDSMRSRLKGRGM